MSYRNGLACRCPSGGLGLGAVAADDQFLASRDFVIRFINQTNTRLQAYADTPAVEAVRAKMGDAVRWFRAALERFYGGKTDDAMESLGVATRLIHEANKLINALSPSDKLAAEEQKKAEAGASFGYQVGETLTSAISEPIAAAVETVSPSVAAAVRSSGWLAPALVGVGLLFLLRR